MQLHRANQLPGMYGSFWQRVGAPLPPSTWIEAVFEKMCARAKWSLPCKEDEALLKRMFASLDLAACETAFRCGGLQGLYSYCNEQDR